MASYSWKSLDGFVKMSDKDKMSPIIQIVVETGPCREWGRGGVGDAGWHQVPELLKGGLSRLGNALPFVVM